MAWQQIMEAAYLQCGSGTHDPKAKVALPWHYDMAPNLVQASSAVFQHTHKTEMALLHLNMLRSVRQACLVSLALTEGVQ